MPIERVVVDASPLICLCKSCLQEILFSLFSDIVVPQAVHGELTAKETDARSFGAFFGHKNVKTSTGIAIPPAVMSWDLGSGESEVLSYALQYPDYRAVVDDSEARKCASTLGCRCIGTVGVILLAKKRGVVSSVKDCLVKLEDAGLWMSRDFVREILLKAGEP